GPKPADRTRASPPGALRGAAGGGDRNRHPFPRREPIRDGSGGRHHARVLGGNDAPERQRQQACIERATTAEMLAQRLALVVPCVVQNHSAQLFGSRRPTRDRTREPEPLPEPRRSVERDLTERRRVGEDPPTAANLPDALVRFTPRVPGGVSDVGQATPEVWLDLSAA